MTMAKQTIHHVDQLMEDVAFIASVLSRDAPLQHEAKFRAIAKRWDGAKAKGVASDEPYMMEAANTAPPPVPDAPAAKPQAKPKAKGRWL